MARGCVVSRGDGGLVRLRVSPGAKSTQLQGLYGEDAFKLKVATPPVDGRANAEVGRFLVRLVGVSTSDVRVVRGRSARDETVFTYGVDAARARKALSPGSP